jgi:tocopherol O-methyltransferase
MVKKNKEYDNYLNEIDHYYKTSNWLYKTFFYKSSKGMHHGYFEKDTKSQEDAIINLNNTIINLTNVNKNHKLLDAGCGVCGTAIHIAKKTGAKVEGITITKSQVKHSKKNINKEKVNHLVNVSLQDFTKTNFPNNHFDVVYGIESICHAYPKSAFLKEAFRVLKPGGKLIIQDGYFKRKPKTNKEKFIFNEFNKSFSLKEMISSKYMINEIKKIGFKNIKVINKTKEVKIFVEKLFLYLKKFKLLINLISWIPLNFVNAAKRNYKAIEMEMLGFDIDLSSYYIHYAEKPK